MLLKLITIDGRVDQIKRRYSLGHLRRLGCAWMIVLGMLFAVGIGFAIVLNALQAVVGSIAIDVLEPFPETVPFSAAVASSAPPPSLEPNAMFRIRTLPIVALSRLAEPSRVIALSAGVLTALLSLLVVLVLLAPILNWERVRLELLRLSAGRLRIKPVLEWLKRHGKKQSQPSRQPLLRRISASCALFSPFELFRALYVLSIARFRLHLTLKLREDGPPQDSHCLSIRIYDPQAQAYYDVEIIGILLTGDVYEEDQVKLRCLAVLGQNLVYGGQNLKTKQKIRFRLFL